ncbi:FAD-binding oxidoreductase [Neptuniibacter halophilus]|uniref:FAD-binding oxidoreductase n=1 Tax=Neptuniibacter halophilus TaxID=651666 RepID=UPI0025722641|nr:FAD-linked oxidase C-terminal domain-containing protein [Neptuniibacter halophilus]
MHQSKPYSQADLKRVINELATTLADRIHLSQAVREQHGQGEDSYGCMPPDAVIYPFSTEEVAQIASLCNRYKIPLIAYGAGSSVEGHLLALQGGICLDLSEMDQVLEINAADMDCRVQAGVSREALNKALRYDGLFFPVDPGANASLGGMASTRASGTNAVRYGTMRDAVIGLTIVTASGEIIRTGGRARKSAAGYDLTAMFVGAEGTLGIITEVQLRLHPVPEQIRAAVCSFETLADAVDSVINARQMALPLARIELLNGLQMQACIDYSKLEGFSASPTLFMEFHGEQTSLDTQITTMQDICNEFGGSAFQWADSTEQRNALWSARHNAYHAAHQLLPGGKVLTTDVCVPVSELAHCILQAEQDAAETGLACPIVGHVGDGNFHMLIVFDPKQPDQSEQARSLSRKIVANALRYEGTCTGEHGIGVGKKAYLLEEHGPAVALMRQLKQALDPNQIMNPGKIFDL